MSAADLTQPTSVPAPGRPRGMFREVLAVLLLTVGSIVPVIPWVVGVALLWTSQRWRLAERVLATLVWPLGYAGVFVAAALFGPVSGGGCTSAARVGSRSADEVTYEATCTHFGPPDWLLTGVLLVLLVAPLVVGAVLLVLAYRRARAQAPA